MIKLSLSEPIIVQMYLWKIIKSQAIMLYNFLDEYTKLIALIIDSAVDPNILATLYQEVVETLNMYYKELTKQK